MANWTITWVPSYGMRTGPEYKTDVTPLGGGRFQRKSRRDNPVRHFYLPFDMRRQAVVVDAVRAFFVARKGAYEAFTFPDYSKSIMGTSLACLEGGAAKDTITDSGSLFVTKDFQAGAYVTIAGSGQGNDGAKLLYTVAAGTLTLATAEDLAPENANANLIVYPTYNVTFADDYIEQVFQTYEASGITTVHLVEAL